LKLGSEKKDQKVSCLLKNSKLGHQPNEKPAVVKKSMLHILVENSIA
jgi:hypothetical protein